jgi:mutual gliding-motility protein MglA
MVQINFAKREINAKVVYYGPGLSGRTTNLDVLWHRAGPVNRGEMTRIATEGDLTLFFDHLTGEKTGGMAIKFQLYCVHGESYYNATRKLVVQGADGVVFVADSRPGRFDANRESFANLEENLREQGLDPNTIPMVFQWNKQDLLDAVSPERLRRALDRQDRPGFAASAEQGRGVTPVFETLRGLVLRKLNVEYTTPMRSKDKPKTPKAPPPKPKRPPPPRIWQLEGPPPPRICEQPPRTVLAEVVEVAGEAALEFDLPPGTGRYALQAFAVRGLDWTQAEAALEVTADPRAELVLPPYVCEGEGARGSALVGSDRGRVRVRLTRDGQPWSAQVDGADFDPDQALPAGLHELTFPVRPGRFELEVALSADGADDVSARADGWVCLPGRFTERVRRLRFLAPGERLEVGDGALGLKVIPLTIDGPSRELVASAVRNPVSSCASVAARAFVALAGCAFAEDDPRLRRSLQGQFLSLLRQLEGLRVPGRGYRLYDHAGDDVHTRSSPFATSSLYDLQILADDPSWPVSLRDALVRAGDLASDVFSYSRGGRLVPYAVRSTQEAHLVLRLLDPSTEAGRARASEDSDGLREEAIDLARATLQGLEADVTPVGSRAELAYAAAALLCLDPLDFDDLGAAIRVANLVGRDLGPGAALYDFRDSSALVVLLSALRARLPGSAATDQLVTVEDRVTRYAQAVELGDVNSVQARESGFVAVEVTEEVSEDWAELEATVALHWCLERVEQAAGEGGSTSSPERRKILEIDAPLVVGETVNLVCWPEGGRVEGDLLLVCLPSALARVEGGRGQRFMVDLEYHAGVRVPLAVIGPTLDPQGQPATQHLAVVLRNCLDEVRVGDPTWIEITVPVAKGTS